MSVFGQRERGKLAGWLQDQPSGVFFTVNEAREGAGIAYHHINSVDNELDAGWNRGSLLRQRGECARYAKPPLKMKAHKYEGRPHFEVEWGVGGEGPAGEHYYRTADFDAAICQMSVPEVENGYCFLTLVTAGGFRLGLFAHELRRVFHDRPPTLSLMYLHKPGALNKHSEQYEAGEIPAELIEHVREQLGAC